MKHELIVKKIQHGTVIDHIPAGKGFDIYKILKLRDERNVHVLLSNVTGKRGKKDVVKIENKYLSEDLLNKISIVAPNATINLIKNFEVVKKYTVPAPKQITGLLKCPNPACITNKANEKIITKFFLKRDELLCHYCERFFKKEEVIFS